MMMAIAQSGISRSSIGSSVMITGLLLMAFYNIIITAAELELCNDSQQRQSQPELVVPLLRCF